MKRLRVLIADDNEAVRTTVAKLLDREFDVVATVKDGGALVEAASKLAPDILVVDISMPVFNGFESINRLRRDGSKAAVVFLTVHDEVDFVREFWAAGGLGYVHKPSMGSDLIFAIKEASAGRHFVSASVGQGPWM